MSDELEKNKELVRKLNVWIRHFGSGVGIRNESTRMRILEDLRAAVVALSPDDMTSDWKLKRTAQCEKCPWRVETDPHEIPNGYSEEKHRALVSTIAKPSDGFSGPERAMACHETHDAHCIGWLVNQLGAGNNIGLRIRMRNCKNADKIRLRGEQHECFEDTLPT